MFKWRGENENNANDAKSTRLKVQKKAQSRGKARLREVRFARTFFDPIMFDR